jgi:hypothetical protein
MRRILACFSALVLGALSSEVVAEDCRVCDREIVLNRHLAQCFLERADGEVAAMKAAGLNYQLFNLSSCPGTGDGPKRGVNPNRGGVQTVISREEIRRSNAATPPQITSTFILDEQGIRCLERLIQESADEFDPAAAFRSAEMCAE